MPGPPQARMTDLHICAMCAPPAPPAPLPILPPCCPTVLVQKLPAARMSDFCASLTPPAPHPIVKGSMTVMIGKLPAARVGIDPCAGGGAILPPAALTVLTGG
ncbi:MAG: PAAR domain-containing protein [Pseudorhodobacter sp.]